jgi:hypothetical protein
MGVFGLLVSQAAWQRILQVLLLAVGGLFIGAVLVVAVTRMAYPYELEWMEGGMLQTVQRIVAGQPIYVEPSVEFVPFIYTPLFFYLGAGVSYFFGDGFLSLRLLSLLAFVKSLGLIFFMVKNRTQSNFWGFIGAALYAACFEIGGGWFDLARVDALSLYFLLLAVYLLEWRQDKIGHILSGLVFVLAFLTKQSMLLVLIPVSLWVVFSGKGMVRWLMPVVASAGIFTSVLLFNMMTDGWFNFYIFQLPTAHAIAWPLVIEFWRFDVLAPFPFALLAMIMLLVPEENKEDQKDKWWLLVLALAFVGTSFSSRLHDGGWNNVLLPGYAMLAVILASTLGRLFRTAGQSLRIILLIVCFLQFSLLIFDPRDHLPSAADQNAGDMLLERLQASNGDAWVPHHGWLAGAAGGSSSAHSMAMEDVLRGSDQEVAKKLDEDIVKDIRAGRWQLVILDNVIYTEELDAKYCSAANAVADSTAFWTVTGLRTRPNFVYEKCDK